MKPMVTCLVTTAWAWIAVSGCSRTSAPIGPPPLGGPTGVVNWSAAADNPLPGVDDGTAYHCGTAFVVWGDGDGGGGGSVGTVEGVKVQGHLLARDKRRVEFQCNTKDGKTGQVTIDGMTYELANGNLFLVATGGNQSQVKQLKRSLAELKFDRESLRAFARSDQDVAGFFTEAAKPR
jgi:hypothetical protein